MNELPNIRPSFVNDKGGSMYASEIFTPESGPSTVVSSATIAAGFQMTLRYEGLLPSEVGDLLEFRQLLRYDDRIRRSSFPFYILSDHPLWLNVPEWPFIEKMLVTGDRDSALWYMADCSAIDTPLTGINSISFKVINEY